MVTIAAAVVKSLQNDGTHRRVRCREKSLPRNDVVAVTSCRNNSSTNEEEKVANAAAQHTTRTTSSLPTIDHYAAAARRVRHNIEDAAAVMFGSESVFLGDLLATPPPLGVLLASIVDARLPPAAPKASAPSPETSSLLPALRVGVAGARGVGTLLRRRGSTGERHASTLMSPSSPLGTPPPARPPCSPAASGVRRRRGSSAPHAGGGVLRGVVGGLLPWPTRDPPGERSPAAPPAASEATLIAASWGLRPAPGLGLGSSSEVVRKMLGCWWAAVVGLPRAPTAAVVGRNAEQPGGVPLPCEAGGTCCLRVRPPERHGAAPSLQVVMECTPLARTCCRHTPPPSCHRLPPPRSGRTPSPQPAAARRRAASGDRGAGTQEQRPIVGGDVDSFRRAHY